jgi:hypothetical protein
MPCAARSAAASPAPAPARSRLRGGGCSGPSAPAGLRRSALSGQGTAAPDHPDYGGEVDHAALIERLAAYDGWALSTSAEALGAWPRMSMLCAVSFLVEYPKPGISHASSQVRGLSKGSFG